MLTPDIRAVLLDADGVCQAPIRRLGSELETLCIDSARAKEFASAVFLAEKPCLIGQADFRFVLGELLRLWDISTPFEEVIGLWRLIQPIPEAMDAISRIRQRGIRVCLATNQQSYRADFMASNLGYSDVFDDLFFSCDLGASKPDADFFSEIIRRLGTPPGELLFIDDQPANVESARDSGLVAEVYHYESGTQTLTRILEQYGLH